MDKIRLVLWINVLSVAFIVINGLVSCQKEDEGNNQKEESFQASFEGEFTNYGTSSIMFGGITIEENNVVTLDVIAGKLIGTAFKNGENYNLSITQTLGIFENILNISGEINTSSETLSVTGTNLDGSSVNIKGNVNVMTTGGWEHLAKSIVIFVHNEVGVTASVTINNVTHSGLNSRFESSEAGVWVGNCERLLTWTHMRGNFDNIQVASDIYCHTGTLKGLSGEPVTFKDCSSIYYILDKNTDYTYTVAWSTGEIHTGQFTSLDGGGNLPICLRRDGGNTGGQTGQFTHNGITYNGQCIITDCNPSCVESTCISIITANSNDGFTFYNIPQSSTGTYQINEFDNNCELSGVCHINRVIGGTYSSYFTRSGTLTKTGAKSFTFSCTIYNTSAPSETHTVTGSGSW